MSGCRLHPTSSACVYLLFEHKSYPDPLMPFQLLKYVVRILERRVREGLPLCCVMSLVVYHGDHPWDAARSLDELIEVPEALQSYVPRFSISLFDLSEIPDDRLGGDAFSQAALLLLKYVRRPELVRRLGEILETLRPILLAESDEARLQAVLVYVASAAPQLRPEQLAGILESKFPKQGQALMATLAEQWMNHGREEGRVEGLEQGRLIGSIQTCKEILGEPLDEAALRRMSLQELQRLAAELQRQVRRTPGDP